MSPTIDLHGYVIKWFQVQNKYDQTDNKHKRSQGSAACLPMEWHPLLHQINRWPFLPKRRNEMLDQYRQTSALPADELHKWLRPIALSTHEILSLFKTGTGQQYLEGYNVL